MLPFLQQTSVCFMVGEYGHPGATCASRWPGVGASEASRTWSCFPLELFPFPDLAISDPWSHGDACPSFSYLQTDSCSGNPWACIIGYATTNKGTSGSPLADIHPRNALKGDSPGMHIVWPHLNLGNTSANRGTPGSPICSCPTRSDPWCPGSLAAGDD